MLDDGMTDVASPTTITRRLLVESQPVQYGLGLFLFRRVSRQIWAVSCEARKTGNCPEDDGRNTQSHSHTEYTITLELISDGRSIFFHVLNNRVVSADVRVHNLQSNTLQNGAYNEAQPKKLPNHWIRAAGAQGYTIANQCNSTDDRHSDSNSFQGLHQFVRLVVKSKVVTKDLVRLADTDGVDGFRSLYKSHSFIGENPCFNDGTSSRNDLDGATVDQRRCTKRYGHKRKGHRNELESGTHGDFAR
mmetsp:Transcript_21968/g.62387  ORF Transcript_21968/g.62387 Transcript_21968/m.62387 type:complete len:247 (-) Transcript_21968:21-761(-)